MKVLMVIFGLFLSFSIMATSSHSLLLSKIGHVGSNMKSNEAVVCYIFEDSVEILNRYGDTLSTKSSLMFNNSVPTVHQMRTQIKQAVGGIQKTIRGPRSKDDEVVYEGYLSLKRSVSLRKSTQKISTINATRAAKNLIKFIDQNCQ